MDGLSTSAPARLAPRDFYRCNRGGGPLSVLLSQRIASHLAATAHRVGATPAVLTAANLVISLAGSVLLLLGAGNAAVGLVVLLAWQLGYAFDCSDGQLARATKTASPSGGRLDVLCDFVGQAALIVAVASVLQDRTDLPVPVLFLGVACWLFNLLLSVLSGDASYTSLSEGRNRVRLLARAVRDHAVVLAVLGVGVVLVATTPVVLAAAFLGFTVLNAALLAGLTVREFLAADRAAKDAGARQGRRPVGAERRPTGSLSPASAE